MANSNILGRSSNGGVFLSRQPRRAFAPSLLLAALGCGCGGGGDAGDEGKGGAALWQDRTYLLEVPRTNWSEPPQIGNEIGDFVPLFLIGVAEAAGDSLAVTVGTADAAGAQNMCSPTSAFEGVVEGYPNVRIGPAALPAHIVHPTQGVEVDATIHELTIQNVLPDGSVLAEEGELSAVMDLRELYPLFTLLPEPSPDAVCTALESFETACEPCGFDGAAYCLSLKAVRLGATEVAGATVVPVDRASADAACPE